MPHSDVGIYTQHLIIPIQPLLVATTLPLAGPPAGFLAGVVGAFLPTDPASVAGVVFRGCEEEPTAACCWDMTGMIKHEGTNAPAEVLTLHQL